MKKNIKTIQSGYSDGQSMQPSFKLHTSQANKTKQNKTEDKQ